ncbi:MAG: hypothetical protein MUE81_24145 [Thermoflexibacter sp.]|nr:hypothetical protein [Thermoflexibacter sp.]
MNSTNNFYYLFAVDLSISVFTAFHYLVSIFIAVCSTNQQAMHLFVFFHQQAKL